MCKQKGLIEMSVDNNKSINTALLMVASSLFLLDFDDVGAAVLLLLIGRNFLSAKDKFKYILGAILIAIIYFFIILIFTNYEMNLIGFSLIKSLTTQYSFENLMYYKFNYNSYSLDDK